MRNPIADALRDERRAETQRTMHCERHGLYHGAGLDDQCPTCQMDGTDAVTGPAPSMVKCPTHGWVRRTNLPCRTCDKPARGARVEECFSCYEKEG